MLAVTRTPLRVSLLGGGSDVPSVYRKIGGAVVGCAIKEWIDVVVRTRRALSGPRFVVACGGFQTADTVDEIEHDLVRETLKSLNVNEPLEIHSLASVPGGTGLGSSSAFTVGLLHALHAYRGETVAPMALAQGAFHIEAERAKRPVGRQDHLLAALGGVRALAFGQDDVVRERKVGGASLARLASSLLLFRLPGTRSAASILSRIALSGATQLETFKRLTGSVEVLVAAIEGDADLRRVGALLHEGWLLKRSLGPVSTAVDEAYARARARGALGGKLLGAGETGFLLLVAEQADHIAIRAALEPYPELGFEIDPLGSRIVLREPHEPADALCR